MKLGLVLCLIVMLLVTINIVSVHAQYGHYLVKQEPMPNYDYYHSHLIPLNSTDLQEARQKMMQIQINSLGEQHTQDLQTIFFLIAIIAGLGSGIIALTVIFIKNRKWKIKPNPDS